MKRDSYVLYSVSMDITTGQFSGADILNCFETEAQAHAALRYEADLELIENNRKCEWLEGNTLRIISGPEGRFETMLYVECTDYHDRDEPLFRYKRKL